jgi:hypothetical protein
MTSHERGTQSWFVAEAAVPETGKRKDSGQLALDIFAQDVGYHDGDVELSENGLDDGDVPGKGGNRHHVAVTERGYGYEAVIQKYGVIVGVVRTE